MGENMVVLTSDLSTVVNVVLALRGNKLTISELNQSIWHVYPQTDLGRIIYYCEK